MHAESFQQMCQQHTVAAKELKQALQCEASQMQASFQQQFADWQQDMLKHDSSPFSRYFRTTASVNVCSVAAAVACNMEAVHKSCLRLGLSTHMAFCLLLAVRHRTS